MPTLPVAAAVTGEATEASLKTLNREVTGSVGKSADDEGVCHLRVLLVNGEAFQMCLPVSSRVGELKQRILVEKPKRKVTVHLCERLYSECVC